jgi:hypothetical protein
MLVCPSSQRTRRRAGSCWSTSSITPARLGVASFSDSTTTLSPARGLIGVSILLRYLLGFLERLARPFSSCLVGAVGRGCTPPGLACVLGLTVPITPVTPSRPTGIVNEAHRPEERGAPRLAHRLGVSRVRIRASPFPHSATRPATSGGSPASTIRRLRRVGVAFSRRFERLRFRLAKRTGEGQTSKGRVGAWTDHRRGARAVDRDDGCLGLGRRHCLRVLCRGCAGEARRGDRCWTTHPASWPRLLRTPAARPPPRLTGAPTPSATVEAGWIIAPPHVLPQPRAAQRMSQFGSSATTREIPHSRERRHHWCDRQREG